MEDNKTPDNQNRKSDGPDQNQQGPPPPKPKKKRRVLRFFVWLFVIIIVLVALAPTLAGLPVVRGFVVGKVNDQLNGTVEIGDWSFGWLSGASIQNVKVLDAEKKQILSIAKINAPVSMLNVARGNIDIGNTSIEGLDFLLQRFPDGTTNFQRLVKASPSEPKVAEKPKTKSEGGGFDPKNLPNVKGNLAVDFKGTIETIDPKNKPTTRPTPTVYVRSGKIGAQITSLSSPIAHQLEISSDISGNPKEGKISINGTVDISKLAVDETLTTTNFPIAIAKAFGGEALDQLDGIANGKIVVNFDGKKGFIEGDQEITSFKAGVPGGSTTQPVVDTYTSKRIKLTIAKTTLETPNGLLVSDGKGGMIVAVNDLAVKIGDGKADAIVLQFDEGDVKILADIKGKTIQSFLDNGKAGDNGIVKGLVAIDDLQSLTKKLPHVIPMNGNVQITSGRYHQDTTLTFTPDRASFVESISLENLEALRDKERIIGKPIKATITGAITPDKKFKFLPSDIDVALDSAFATAKITGKTIDQLAGTINVSLKDMQTELGQFLDFGALKFEGKVEAKISSDGDYVRNEETGSLKVRADITSTQVKIDGLTKTKVLKTTTQPNIPDQIVKLAPIDQRWVYSKVQATVQRSGPLAKDISVNLKTDNEQKPEIAIDATVESFDTGKNGGLPIVHKFNLAKTDIDLKAVHKNFGGLLPEAMQDGLAGTITASAQADCVDNKATLSNLVVDALHVSVGKTSAKDLSFHTEVDATATLATTKDVEITKLSVKGQNAGKAFLNVEKLGDKNLVVHLGETMQANGGVKLSADVQQALDLVQEITGKEIELYVNGNRAKLQGGNVDGEIRANYADKGSDISGFIQANDLTVADTVTKEQPLVKESVRIDLNGINISNDYSALRATAINLSGTMMKGSISDVQVALAPMDLWQMRANIAMHINAAKAQAAAGLMSKPSTQPVEQPANKAVAARPAAKPAPAKKSDDDDDETPDGPAEPIQLVRGDLDINLSIRRNEKNQLSVKLSELKAENLEIKRGKGGHVFAPINANADITVDAMYASGVGIAEQIKQINVNGLSGKFGFATVDVVDPIVAKTITTTPSASGKIRVTASLKDTMAIVAAIGGQDAADALKYSGLLTCTETIASENGEIKLVSSDAKITDLQLQKGANTFSERLVVFENDISARLAEEIITVRKVRLDMQGSQAFSASISGKIRRFKKYPTFEALADNSPAGRTGMKGLNAVISYDGEKIRDMLAPFVGDAAWFKGMKLEAKVKDDPIIVAGSFAATKNYPQSIKPMKADADLNLKNIEIPEYGLKITDFAPMFVLDSGVAKIADAKGAQATPTKCNEGILNLAGISVALTPGPVPHFHIPPGKITSDVQLNALFVKLLQFIPIFAESNQATGKLDLEVVECEDLPLDWLLPRDPDNPKALSKGKRAEFYLSIKNATVDSTIIRGINALTGRDAPGLSVAIDRAHIVIDNKGEVTINVPLKIDNNTLLLAGSASLPKQQILGAMDIGLPKSLIKKIGGDVTKFLPETIHAPLTGALSAPSFDFGQAIQRSLLGGPGGNPADAIGNILKGLGDSDSHRKKDKGKSGANAAPADNAVGQPQQPVEGIPGIIGDLLKGKDKDNDEPKQKAQPKADPKKPDTKTDPKKPIDTKKPADEPKAKNPLEDLLGNLKPADDPKKSDKPADDRKVKPATKPATKPAPKSTDPKNQKGTK